MFAKAGERDGRPHYLQHLPRVWDISPQHWITRILRPWLTGWAGLCRTWWTDDGFDKNHNSDGAGGGPRHTDAGFRRRTPKPLTPLAGRTFTGPDDRQAGGRAVLNASVVNVHFKADWIEAHLKPMASNRLEIIISDERSELLETGGGVFHAGHVLGDVPFYVCNADVFWREDHNNLLSLAEHFDATRMAACLLLADRGTASGFDGAGDFFMTPQGKLSRRGTALRRTMGLCGCADCPA